MTYPVPYVVSYSYTAFQQSQGNNSFPGTQLDNELATIASALNAAIAFIQNAIRSDGYLANGIVTYDSLSAALQSSGLAGATAWLTATTYGVGIPVTINSNLYRCLVAHTSGVFATDLAAGKWVLVAALATGAAGTNGNSVLSGAGAPGAGLGNNGDFYIDTTAKAIYGAKTAGAWGGATSLIGPSGALGVSGVPTAGQIGIWTNGTTQQGVSVLPANSGGTGVANNVASTITISGSFGTTFTVSAATSVTLPIAGTLATLAGVEAFTNKTYNGNILTAGTYTLTGVAGKTLTFSNTLTLSGTDGSAFAIGVGGTLTGSSSAAIFYDNIPQNSKSANYTTVLADNGKHLLHPAADTTARTFTIDSNANVAQPIGATHTFINQNAAGVLTIAITTDTMRLAGAGTTGSRTLAANGLAVATKITATEWIISGTGLT